MYPGWCRKRGGVPGVVPGLVYPACVHHLVLATLHVTDLLHRRPAPSSRTDVSGRHPWGSGPLYSLGRCPWSATLPRVVTVPREAGTGKTRRKGAIPGNDQIAAGCLRL